MGLQSNQIEVGDSHKLGATPAPAHLAVGTALWIEGSVAALMSTFLLVACRIPPCAKAAGLEGEGSGDTTLVSLCSVSCGDVVFGSVTFLSVCEEQSIVLATT